MEIIVITPANTITDEVYIIHQLFINGLMKLHIRKPNYTMDEVKQYLLQIDAAHHHKIVLHQYPELMLQFNLAGFHITQHYMPMIDSIKEMILPHQSLSISCHSFDEIQQLNGFDYYFISPIFDSISKANYKSAFSIDEIKNALAICNNKKIIALGGINADNMQLIKLMQFNGVALLGGLWQAIDITAEWKKIAFGIKET
ncbi:MAG: hypothetical protein RJA07_1495 [Bacteroidota bacterium]|jgi:thiamine-phosphate pyrophosphorylase